MSKSAQQQKKDEAKEAERKRETSKAAQKAINAQKEAKRLTQAAAAAGDPDERQKLLNQALEKEVEAETFGKTAKYLQTGPFQGLCAGAGLGGSVGVWLGAVTGTLVGGTTSLITGGLGAGIGLGVGAAHGPWFKVGEWMGEGIRKITGDIPGWKSTDEQKKALEDMVNGVREQDRPGEEELIQMTEDSAPIQAGKGYTGQRKEDEGEQGLLQGYKPSVPSMPVPSIPGFKSKKTTDNQPTKSKVQGHGSQVKQPVKQTNGVPTGMAGKVVTPTADSSVQHRSQAPAQQQTKATFANKQRAPRTGTNTHTQRNSSRPRGQTPVGEQKYPIGEQPVQPTPRTKKPPRKLEIRSKQAG